MTIIATTAVLVAVAFGGLNAGFADFVCFYAAPIGHEKCTGVSHGGPFAVGFLNTIGVLCIPWSLLLIFFLIRNRRRTK